jgi:MoaA/NifB/PqqE/SkfB family radical SAM enzyme
MEPATHEFDLSQSRLQRISLELTNTCNLHCSYCMRDEDALYHTRARFFTVDLLEKTLRSARLAYGTSSISFTGGEPTIHPNFGEVLDVVSNQGYSFNLVSNGWHFDRVLPALMAHRARIEAISFSLDGDSKESHDRWRGEGSFARLIRAVTLCRANGIPFSFKITIRQDTLPHLEKFALMAAKLGSSSLIFSHLLPTSSEFDSEMSLSAGERTNAEHEIAILSGIFKMKIGISVGYYNLDPAPPCGFLAGSICNIDYLGRLTLCCNMSGYRGASGEPDVAADLNEEDFVTAFSRLQQIAAEQLERRRRTLQEFDSRQEIPDISVGSPCQFCLKCFDKISWRDSVEERLKPHSLPVIAARQSKEVMNDSGLH